VDRAAVAAADLTATGIATGLAAAVAVVAGAAAIPRAAVFRLKITATVPGSPANRAGNFPRFIPALCVARISARSKEI
jgi:hypothetical protein